MGDDTCKRPTCDNESREYGEYQYDDPEKTASNGERYTVSRFGAKFCSDHCELKYEHIKADAEDARRADEERHAVDKKDLPEYDGPPY